MQDVTQGVERTRAWPRPRGAPKNPTDAENREKFRQAQLATKYIAPQLYVDAINATQGTPLLPRDMLTMQLYNRMLAFILPGGRILWPMPARQDVSEALDIIGAAPGDTLVRGPNGWQALPASGGGLNCQSDTINVAESTPNTFYSDLATVGPTVEVETGTDALVILGANVVKLSGGESFTAYLSLEVSLASTIPPHADRSIQFSGVKVGFALAMSRTFKISGLTPGVNRFRLKYRSDGGGPWLFYNRDLTVIAL